MRGSQTLVESVTGTLREFLNVGAKTLRERLRQGRLGKLNQRKFDEAVKVFEEQIRRHSALDDLQPHLEESFFKTVETRVHEIIYGLMTGNALPKGSFVPTPRESLLILVSIWFQHFGLVFELNRAQRDSIAKAKIESERLTDRIAVDRGERTACFVHEVAKLLMPSWTVDDIHALADICRCIPHGYQETPYGYEGIRGLPNDPSTLSGLERDPQAANLQLIAALIRLANLCTVNEDFCPLDLRSLLKPEYGNGHDSCFIGILDYLQDLRVEHVRQALVVNALAPAPIDRMEVPDEAGRIYPLTLDVRSSLEFLRSRMGLIIEGVSPFLMKCASTRIDRVHCEHSDTRLLTGFDPFLRNAWGLHIASTTCATEGACAFAVVQLFDVEAELVRPISTTSLKKRLTNKCEPLCEIQPFNIVAVRLAREIQSRIATWPNDPSVLVSDSELNEFKQHIESFLEDRKTCCELVGEHAARGATEAFQKAFSECSVVIVYGISRNVFQALFQTGFAMRGRILAVPVNPRFWRPEVAFFEGEEGQPLLAGEDARVRAWCAEHKCKLDFVDSRALEQRLQAIKRTGTKFIFMASARSVIVEGGSRTSFVTLGNHIISQAVRASGGKVAVIAESGKVATGIEARHLRATQDNVLADCDKPDYERVDELTDDDVDFWVIPGIDTQSRDGQFRRFRL